MRTRSYAFTLVELLIVMGVLGLLLAIVLPTFGRVMTISRRLACQANLSHIGKAYNARRSDEPTLNRTVFKADHWARDLAPYLSYHPQAFYCLEDEETATGLPDVKIWCPARGYYLEMFSAYPYWLESPARDIQGGTPGVWKLNDEDYQAIKPFIQERRGLVHLLPQFTPGINPRTYWFLFEDQRTGEDLWAGDDKDFEDLIIRVIETRNNSVELHCTRGVTFHTFDLVGPDDTVFLNVGSGNNGPFHFDGTGNISYGMNWRAEFITGGAQKVLVLDYETEVCYVGGEAPPYAGQGWDEMQAPRHFGKSNVLFSGGEVRIMAPDEIDPDVDANDAQYWDPKR